MSAPPVLAPNIRITEGGSVRITGDGAIRVAGYYEVPEPLPLPIAVPEVRFPGIVVQANLLEAIAQWRAEHGGVLLEADQPAVLALANTLLADDVVAPYVPTKQENYPPQLPPPTPPLPRFPDANPATDGWSIVDDEKVVHGGKP